MTPVDRVRQFDPKVAPQEFLAVALSVRRASLARSARPMSFADAMHHAFTLIHATAVDGDDPQ